MHRWMLVVLMGCLAGTAGAAGLEMVYPNGGESLVAGDTIAIKWKTGGITENVTLVLMQNGKYLAHIFGNIPNTGSKTWQVGKCVGMMLTSGSGYVIKVRTVSGSTHDDMDGPFSLSTPLAPVPPPNPPPMILMPYISKLIYFHKPLNAKLKIQNYAFTMAGPGKIGWLEASLLVQSEREWQIGDFGDPIRGSQWMQCTIENPTYQEGVGIRGERICSPSASVLGTGAADKFLYYPTQIFAKGTSTYTLRVQSTCLAPLQGLRTIVKKTQQPFMPGGLCFSNYYPKITMEVCMYTEVSSGSWINVFDTLTFYIQYPPLPDWIPLKDVMLPGETDLCGGPAVNKW